MPDMTDVTQSPQAGQREQDETLDQAPDGLTDGHGGEHAVAVAAAHGVDTMFTLSGAHVFPMYDGAVNAEPEAKLICFLISMRSRLMTTIL